MKFAQREMLHNDLVDFLLSKRKEKGGGKIGGINLHYVTDAKKILHDRDSAVEERFSGD